VLYKPQETKYHKLRLSKAKVKKVIVDVVGGIKLLKLAGFEPKTENDGEKVLSIEPPSTIEEFEQLSDLWLVLMKTQYLWGINPDSNAPKNAAFPKQFKIPNTMKYAMDAFFKSNEIAKSSEFQEFVGKSNDLNLSRNAVQRYNYFGKAIKLILNSSNHSDFFGLNAMNGLNDIDVSDVAALIISEILCGYHDEDEAYKNLILGQDLKILTKYKENERILFKMKDEERTGTIRWIGESEKWPKGIWFGIELDAEDLVFGHNGYFNQERFFGCPDKYGLYIKDSQIVRKINDETQKEKEVVDDDEKKEIVENAQYDNSEQSEYKIIDIGCGWGNFGRLLMDKQQRPYLEEIENESELKKVGIYGFDVSEEMISIAKHEKNKFDVYYKDMVVWDCKRNELRQFGDGTVDIITSSNCMMQDKQSGHPNETFLIEANRLLKVNGWMVITRRFHGLHLGLQLYSYLMIAQQLGWKNVFASRIREIFYIGWQKMENPNNE